MGNTGYTFGEHLHFQVIQNRNIINTLLYLNDQKLLVPYSENSYTKSNYVVTAYVLNVRKGSGTNYDIVRYPELTDNAKKQMKEFANYPASGYVKGDGIYCFRDKKLGGKTWVKTTSGWVCIYNKMEYIAKRYEVFILRKIKILTNVI